MPNTIQSPNTVILDTELLPGEVMFDAKVMHEPSAKFLYEVRCPNCQQDTVRVSLRRGFRCAACEFNDPNMKTYRRLVKAEA